jgi:hypothetical protein
MLGSLERHYRQLCAASAEFGRYAEGLGFAAELVLFSGHMELDIARLEDGTVRWFIELDK